MNQWVQVVLWITATAVLGIFERQLAQIITLLREIRDRLPEE